MSTFQRLLILLVIAGLACRHDDPTFCENAPHHNCIAIDAQQVCTMDHDCLAPTAVCDLATATCVQCTQTEHDACQGAVPVCGDNHACQACAAHADCPTSLACLPDGSCGSDANVAYVDPAGTDTGPDGSSCTFAMPCLTVSKALATTRPFIKFHGLTKEAVSMTDRNVTFLADPGAQLTRPDSGVLLEIRGRSQVSIYDLEITGASGSNGIGISIPPGSTASLTLQRAKVTANAGGGISATGATLAIIASSFSGNHGGAISSTYGTLTVAQSTISGDQGSGIGILAIGGILTITRTTISGNLGGGVQMSNLGSVGLENNIIHHNGNDGLFGGLSLYISGGSRVQFNTIVDNRASLAHGSAGGVACISKVFTAANNLIFRNTGGADGTVQVVTESCAFGNSFVAFAPTSDNTPQFKHPNTAPYDYHLTSSTPSTILDAAWPCTDTDHDGDARPIGAACDLGADEYHP